MVEGNSNESNFIECNSIEGISIEGDIIETPNIYPNDQQKQFRLNEVNEIKDYFIAEIEERELMSKRLSKCIASFGYYDKSLIVLSATSCYSYLGTVRIESASLSLTFSISTGLAKKILKTTRNKKKKA